MSQRNQITIGSRVKVVPGTFSQTDHADGVVVKIWLHQTRHGKKAMRVALRADDGGRRYAWLNECSHVGD